MQNELPYYFCLEKLKSWANQLSTTYLGEDLACNMQIIFFFYDPYYTIQVNKVIPHEDRAASINTYILLLIVSNYILQEKKTILIHKGIICFPFTSLPPPKVFGASRLPFYGVSS